MAFDLQILPWVPARGVRHLLQAADWLLQVFKGARTALNEAQKLLGGGSALHAALAKLKAMEKEEKERQRAMFGGTIQTKSEAKRQQEEYDTFVQKRDRLHFCMRILFFPVIFPYERIHALGKLLFRFSQFLVHFMRQKKYGTEIVDKED